MIQVSTLFLKTDKLPILRFQAFIHPMTIRNSLVGRDDLGYIIGITDKRISIATHLGIWICTNATTGMFV